MIFNERLALVKRLLVAGASTELLEELIPHICYLVERIEQYERWVQQELDLRGKEFLDWLNEDGN